MRSIVWGLAVAGAAFGAAAELTWDGLPTLPDAMSGHVAGVVDEHLVVAGGSSFPTPPWEGGAKQWLTAVYTLDLAAADAVWEKRFDLPEARAYGAAVAVDGAMLLLGGSDGTAHYDTVFAIAQGDSSAHGADPRWVDAVVHAETEGWRLLALPSLALPSPNAYFAAGRLTAPTAERHLVIAGGSTSPASDTALDAVWTFNLDAPTSWTPGPSIPSAGRILPSSTVAGNALFVIGGADLAPGADGFTTRAYLTDAHRFSLMSGWEPIAPAPTPVAAAPAAPYRDHVMVFSGDSGELFARGSALGLEHPGFAPTVWLYNATLNAWSNIGTMDAPVVTAPAVTWEEGAIVVAGEDRPGHRTDAVVAAIVSPAPGRLNAFDYTAIALYLAVLVAMGYYFSRREKNTENYFLGGRRVPWWAVGISIFGTSLSAITYLSIPAQAFAVNWTTILANAGIVILAPSISRPGSTSPCGYTAAFASSRSRPCAWGLSCCCRPWRFQRRWDWTSTCVSH